MIHRKHMIGWSTNWFARSKPGDGMSSPEKRTHFKEKWMNNWKSTVFQIHGSFLFLRNQKSGHPPKTSNQGANSIYPDISYICL
ncbi:MAG: hypothetical protein V3V14_08875 [Saprospiraceae bacterium]